MLVQIVCGLDSDIAHLQTYMATPGKLLPWEVPAVARKLESGHFEIVYLLPSSANEDQIPGGLWLATVSVPEPQPFTPLIIRSPDGIGEPIFTSTEVAFHGDSNTQYYAEAFRITLHQLETPNFDGCKTNMYSYDILVRCAIVRFVHYFPIVRIHSDGGSLFGKYQ